MYKSGSSWIEHIDICDLRVNIIKFTKEDGYPYNTIYDEDGNIYWEAKCEDEWYTFRGTYSGYDVYLDEVISGHSGYRRDHSIGENELNWFDEILADTIKQKIEQLIE